MRYVVRPPAPPSLDGPACHGAREHANAVDHYAGAGTPAYKFKAYKRPDVVDALERAFNYKCAYCETNGSAGYPVDVEHYRPKGGVEGDDTHPGYWWLAATWTNLLPSCADCNRRRKHRIATPGLTLDELARLKKQTSGKQNSFPIEGVRAAAAGADHDAERAVLIDPTATAPELHIGWSFEGGLTLAVPKSVEGVPDRRGTGTIFTFGLNRQKLVEERTSLADAIRVEFVEAASFLALAARTSDNDTRRDLIAAIMGKLERIEDRAASSAPYSAMARELIDMERRRLDATFESLLA